MLIWSIQFHKLHESLMTLRSQGCCNLVGKLDGVGLNDNKPLTNKLHHLEEKDDWVN